MPLHRALTRANFPWVTLALIVVNLFVFVALQGGDGARYESALTFYAEHHLDTREFPLYAAWLERERPRADTAARMREANAVGFPQGVALIEADAEFLQALHADRIVAPDADGYAEWKADRDAFDALWSTIFTERWNLRFSEIAPSRMLGAMFLHGSVGHLLGNMLFLALLGLLVEGALGPWLFLAVYLLGGVGGALASLAWRHGDVGTALGASGAIAALMGAYCVLWGTRKVRFFWWFFVAFDYVRAPALVLLPFWLGWQLLNLLWNKGAHVGFDAHAGGIVTGALLALGIRTLGWERRDFLDEDARADEAADARAALARADEHIGRLEIAAARALLEPLAERAPDDVAVAAALYRCARYERGTPRIDAAARAALALNAAGAREVRLQKDVYDDYVRTRADSAIVPPSLAIALASRWVAIGAGADAATLLARIIERSPSASGLEGACLALARALRERGEKGTATGLLERIVRTWPASPGAEKARILLADA
ncbi:MAG TPA: rhomboid family intramembrane serine protease [Rhodanobacteraceae bacterium]